MRLPLQLTLFAIGLPSLSLASLEAGASSEEPTTTLYSTSTRTKTQTIIAASVTQTLTSISAIASAAVSSAPSSSSPLSSPSSSAVYIASSSSAVYIAPTSLPPTGPAPYPIPISSVAGGIAAGSASAPLPSGTGAAAGTGVPAGPGQPIEPFPGAGSRVVGQAQWVGAVGAVVVGLGLVL